jgi:hypothetical protein
MDWGRKREGQETRSKEVRKVKNGYRVQRETDNNLITVRVTSEEDWMAKNREIEWTGKFELKLGRGLG